MMVIPLQVKLTQVTPFTLYTMHKQQTQLIGILISGEGNCGEGDCGEGEWIPNLLTYLRYNNLFSCWTRRELVISAE